MNRAERSRELETLARENNWSFAPTGNVPAIEKFEFPKGEKRKVERIENLIRGENFKCFDVYWQNEFNVSDAFGPLAHKNMTAKNARQQTFVLFESTDLHLPKFHVYPANSGGWLNKFFRQADSEFAKNWSVEGARESVINENLAGFYEKSDGFWTFAVDNFIFIYQPDILISPSQIADWSERISVLGKLFENE